MNGTSSKGQHTTVMDKRQNIRPNIRTHRLSLDLLTQLLHPDRGLSDVLANLDRAAVNMNGVRENQPQGYLFYKDNRGMYFSFSWK